MKRMEEVNGVIVMSEWSEKSYRTLLYYNTVQFLEGPTAKSMCHRIS